MARKNTDQQERLNGLLRKAASGDKSALPALRAELTDDMWRQMGDAVFQAQHALITLYTGKNALAAEAMERRLSQMRESLTGPAPTPLDRLLAERIATCWLDVNQAERAAAYHFQEGGLIVLGDYLQRRLDGAHRRYLSAIRTLAQVRRLPAVQVNIAEQQVNVAGS